MTIRIHTKILPGHRIEVTAPQLSEGTAIDVLVVTADEGSPRTPQRRQLLSMPIEERRQLLMQQSKRLASHYDTDADRSD